MTMDDDVEQVDKVSGELTDALTKTLGDLRDRLLVKYDISHTALTLAIAKACMNMAAMSALATTDATLEETQSLCRELYDSVTRAVKQQDKKRGNQ